MVNYLVLFFLCLYNNRSRGLYIELIAGKKLGYECKKTHTLRYASKRICSTSEHTWDSKSRSKGNAPG
jgi:hypothetical protein